MTSSSYEKQRVYDYIIAGQGIAGTMLSYHLAREGASVLVADPCDKVSSTFVSAGVMNPVTGRRLVKTWLADKLFPYLHKVYADFSELLSVPLYKPFDIYKVFGNEKTQNDWLAKSGTPDMLPYLPETSPVYLSHDRYLNPLGSIKICKAGHVDLKALILHYRHELQKKGCFIRARVVAKEVTHMNNYVAWHKYKARKLIFCNGIHALDTPWFKCLPFNPTKGEMLFIKCKLEEDFLVHKGVYIIPVGNGFFKAGATNLSKYNHSAPSNEGRAELIEKINRLLTTPYSVTGHLSGIRPSTHDRKPFAGVHPETPQIAVFSGLGAKGASLAPYLAHCLTRHLLYEDPLPPEVNPFR